MTQLAEIERRSELRRLLRLLAGSMAQPVNVERVASEVGLPVGTPPEERAANARLLDDLSAEAAELGETDVVYLAALASASGDAARMLAGMSAANGICPLADAGTCPTTASSPQFVVAIPCESMIPRPARDRRLSQCYWVLGGRTKCAG